MRVKQRTVPTIFTGDQLQALEVIPDEWVVDGLFRTNRRRPSVIAGKPGAGKSSLAWQMAVDVAEGKSFLGRITKPCEVIFWQTEETPEEVAAILRGLDYHPTKAQAIHVVMGTSCGGTLDHRLDVVAALLAERPNVQLVIFETLDDFLQITDIKENSASREAFEKFDAAIMSRFAKQAVFVALHHLKKREGDTSGDNLLGASVIAGRTDVKVFLNVASDDDPRRIIHSTKRRGGTAIEKTYLDFEHKTGRNSLGITLADERKQSVAGSASRLSRDIIEFFIHHQSATESDCLSLIRGNSDEKRDKFRGLVRVGTLCRSGKGTKGSPYTYRLAEIPAEERRVA